MGNGKLNLSTTSLEEQDKVATSLEDVYGYQVLSKKFEAQIEEYNRVKKINREQCVDKVFYNKQVDDIGNIFDAIIEADTNVVVEEWNFSEGKEKDSPIAIMGFFFAGAIITAFILMLVERKRKNR